MVLLFPRFARRTTYDAYYYFLSAAVNVGSFHVPKQTLLSAIASQIHSMECEYWFVERILPYQRMG